MSQQDFLCVDCGIIFTIQFKKLLWNKNVCCPCCGATRNRLKKRHSCWVREKTGSGTILSSDCDD